ncbi:protein kinase [bacterium]|nr:protein kinase [bacterium]
MIGKTISHYKIIEKLGEGGMGVVYKAEDTKLKRNVALKFLPPEMTRDPQAKQRFVKEAQTASSLQHQNISTIHEIDETDDGRLYICMDYYDGETLRDRIQKETLEFEKIIDMTIQIAEGLKEAHSKGIIHRDIKSANIIITSQGQAKIMDFGLAKLTGQPGPTKTGLTPGTIAYMSPEQTKGETVDSRTDIWSLGVVLYEMVTNQLPFKGEYEQAVIYSILNEDPEPVSQIRKGVPEELERIIRKCLEKKADSRYQTADALLKDLRVLKDNEPISKIGHYKHVAPPLRKITNKTVRQIILLLMVILLIMSIFNYHSLKEKLGFTTIPREKGIAVLPFINIGNLSINQVWCDGFQEGLTSIITQLEEFQDQLWVVPSSEIRSHKITSVQEAKKVFNVNLVYTGSIRFDINNIFMTINLVDAKSLRQLKSIIIEDQVSNLSMILDSIIMQLVDMLKIVLQPKQLASLKIGETKNSLALDYYIRGRGYLLDYQDEDSLNTAITLFEQALQEDEDYALAHAGLGKAYLFKYRLTKNVQDIDEAVQYCNRSLDLNGQLTPVRITLGSIYIEKGYYAEAAEIFSEAIQLDSTDAEAYRELGYAYEKMGRSEDAEANYKKAIELKPLYWGHYSYLGGFYSDHARYQEAIEQFRQVIRLAPENTRGYNNLGGIYIFLEQWDKAQEILEKSIDIKPTNTAYYNLATAHYYQYHYDEAIEFYERILADEPNQDYRVWGALAESYYWAEGKRYLAAEKYRQAISLAEEQLTVNPKDPDILSDLSGYYANLGNREKSMTLLNRVIALEPASLEVQFRIAETYQQLGYEEEALNWLAVVLNKGYSPLRIEQNPHFKDLKSDARFEKILEDRSQNILIDKQ